MPGIGVVAMVQGAETVSNTGYCQTVSIAGVGSSSQVGNQAMGRLFLL